MSSGIPVRAKNRKISFENPRRCLPVEKTLGFEQKDCCAVLCVPLACSAGPLVWVLVALQAWVKWHFPSPFFFPPPLWSADTCAGCVEALDASDATAAVRLSARARRAGRDGFLPESDNVNIASKTPRGTGSRELSGLANCHTRRRRQLAGCSQSLSSHRRDEILEG